jgi:pimeloyl-ACP methyl ester carboxylesterase
MAIVRIAALVCSVTLVAGSAVAQNPDKCGALDGTAVLKTQIGLPSGDATIASTAPATIPTTMAAPEPAVSYCKVLGAIAPIDPNAPPIQFQINLPAQWNARAVQYGGGGYNGVLITGLAQLRDSPTDLAPPLARGFMTYGTDSGHDGAKLPEIMAFALNDEALENFAHASYKKVRDVATAVARAYYGRAPEKIYFFGGSEGGREGLTMAQRYPTDFDGVVSVVPVINWVGLQFSGTRTGLAQRDGGWISPAKVKAIHQAVLAACDKADGLADGIVSRPDVCTKTFEAKSLRCADGTDSGESCLSDAQLKVAETIRQRFEFPYPLANGVSSYPAWNWGGEDQPDGMVNWATGPKVPQFPLPAPTEQARDWYYGAGAMRYFIARDPAKDPRDITPAAFKEQAQKISALMDSTNPDLSAFLARGGKLILKENLSDFGQSPNAGIEYYKSVVARMGQPNVDRFIRFYLTPGASHSGAGLPNGAPLPQGVDLLGALDTWVIKDEAPGDLVQVAKDNKAPFAQTAARPMCRYPAYPRYKGEGDPKSAGSFECTVE